MIRRFRTAALAVLGAALAGGCGVFGGDDPVEPPAELVEFDATLDIDETWSVNVGDGGEGLRLGLRPASDGAQIYAGAYDGTVAAYNAETGRRQWQVDTELPLSAGPGYGSGMLAFGTANGEMILLDASDGSELWRRSVDSEVLAPPAVTGSAVIFYSVDGRLRSLSARDGTTQWTQQQSVPVLSLRGNAAPRVSGNVVVAGFDNGRVGAYQTGSGEILWETPIATPTGTNELEQLVDVATDLEIVGNDVYTATYQGRAVGIDLNNGIVFWQQDLSSFAGVGVDANNVYVTNDVGAVIALGRRSGTELWRQEALRLRDVTAAARLGNTLVVGDFEGYVHFLSPEDGSFLAREDVASGRILDAPLVVGRRIFVQADDGTLAALTIVEDEE